MSWEILAATFVLVLLAAAWHANLGARELANRAAQEACEGAGARMLDGTVAVHRIRLARHHGGPLRVHRIYLFDYSDDGYNRRRGFVVLAGLEVESVGLGPRSV